MSNALTNYLARSCRYALVIWPVACVALVVAKLVGAL